MRNIFFVLMLLSVIACSNKDQNQSVAISDIRAHGQGILDGEITPGDDTETFACLDSIDDSIYETRQFFFQVYRVIALGSDGALSEMVSGITHSYLSLYPEEAIGHFKSFSEKEQEVFIDNLAFEFYTSGLEGEEEINSYFDEMKNKCPKCNQDETLNKIKTRVQKRFEEIQD